MFDKVKAREARRREEHAAKAQARTEQDRINDDAKLREHGLLLDESDDAEIRAKNAASLRRILGERGWSGYWSAGTMFSDAADKVEINLLKMLTEQQFVIIRQNEQIIRLLDRQSRGADTA